MLPGGIPQGGGDACLNKVGNKMSKAALEASARINLCHSEVYRLHVNTDQYDTVLSDVQTKNQKSNY